MPEREGTNDLMWQTFANYEQQLYENGSLEVQGVPEPTLINDIHPIFHPERWATGPYQGTHHFYHRMIVPLRLASLMLTEDCALPWFTHLTYGHRKEDYFNGKPKVFVQPTKIEHTPYGRRKTKRKLRQLAHMIAFVWTPPGSLDHDVMDARAYGITWPSKSHVPFSYNFRSHNWPTIDPKYRSGYWARRPKPVISLRQDFGQFFCKGYRTATPCERYRAWFMFASTIVHEVAHAYYTWLGRHSTKHFYADGNEPHWSVEEKNAELGFSWESVTWGRVIDPWQGEILNCHALTSIQTREFRHPKDRDRELYSLIEKNGTKLHKCPLPRGQAAWIPSKTWRGNQWFCEDGGLANLNYICVIHAIPMNWVFQWFQVGSWEERRQEFKRSGKYAPPGLGPTFVLVYERDWKGKASLRVGLKQDADPYLGMVKGLAQRMHLYDEGYWEGWVGEYSEEYEDEYECGYC